MSDEKMNVDAIIGWPVNLSMDGNKMEGTVTAYDPETGYGEVTIPGRFKLKVYLGKASA